MTDPIADMLTRIRNALVSKHDAVEMPASKMKKSIADILVAEGYLTSVEEVGEGTQSKLVITLKYGAKKEAVIKGLKRISKPGLRVYAGYDEIPSVLGGLGISIVSTSKGVMTGKQAKATKNGGEVLAYVW